MNHTTTENNEFRLFSLSSLFIVLKKEYKIILLFTLFFSIFGIFYILNTPIEYISTGKIMPEVSYKASNGMGGLYALLKKYNNNIDLSNTEITSSELYSEILQTNDFYDYILSKKVTTINNKKMSFKYYYNNLGNKNSFFEKERSDLRTNKTKHYSTLQDIQKRIVINTNKKNNIIFVTVKMPDPVVGADIANFTITYLITYITKYRTEKARQELHFIENLQKNILKDSSKNEDLKKEIQSSLLASTIQMKIKIQEDTPIFQVLEKAQIPIVSSEPSAPKILTEFIFIGLLFGGIIALFRNQNYKLLLNSN